MLVAWGGRCLRKGPSLGPGRGWGRGPPAVRVMRRGASPVAAELAGLLPGWTWGDGAAGGSSARAPRAEISRGRWSCEWGAKGVRGALQSWWGLGAASTVAAGDGARRMAGRALGAPTAGGGGGSRPHSRLHLHLHLHAGCTRHSPYVKKGPRAGMPPLRPCWDPAPAPGRLLKEEMSYQNRNSFPYQKNKKKNNVGRPLYGAVETNPTRAEV